MAYVGYIEKENGDFAVVGAGKSYAEAFQRTFARVAPMVTAFGAPNMVVQERDITDDEAAEIEAICTSYLETHHE